MESISIYLEYLYAPIIALLFLNHTRLIRLETKVNVSANTEHIENIYSSILQLEKDVHYLIKTKEQK